MLRDVSTTDHVRLVFSEEFRVDLPGVEGMAFCFETHPVEERYSRGPRELAVEDIKLVLRFSVWYSSLGLEVA